MEFKDFLLVGLPIFTALLSSYLTYYFAIKTKRKESITKFKEEKYTNLIIALQGFVGSTVSASTKKKFFEEQYKSWLYSSDDVVKSINELIKLLIELNGVAPNPQKGQEVIGNIVLAMRQDLLGATKLTYEDFKYTDVIN